MGHARMACASVAQVGLDLSATHQCRVLEIRSAAETEIASTALVLARMDGLVPIVAHPIAPMDVVGMASVKEEARVCVIPVGADLHARLQLRVLEIHHAQVTGHVSMVHAPAALDTVALNVEHPLALEIRHVTGTGIARTVTVFVRQDLRVLVVSP